MSFENKIKEVYTKSYRGFTRDCSKFEIHDNFLYIVRKKRKYCLYFDTQELTIFNALNTYFKTKTFDEWRNLEQSLLGISLRDKTKAYKEIKKIQISSYFFACRIMPLFSKLFEIIEKEYENNEDLILFPINNNISISYLKQQDWYKKLLQDYTEYYQSGSKSDIADRHYQEQARLHGLKFVIK